MVCSEGCCFKRTFSVSPSVCRSLTLSLSLFLSPTFSLPRSLSLSPPANNLGGPRRQISDLLDQSIHISSQCFLITADNRFILLCGFWDKSFRVYSTDSGTAYTLTLTLTLTHSHTQKYTYTQIHIIQYNTQTDQTRSFVT